MKPIQNLQMDELSHLFGNRSSQLVRAQAPTIWWAVVGDWNERTHKYVKLVRRPIWEGIDPLNLFRNSSLMVNRPRKIIQFLFTLFVKIHWHSHGSQRHQITNLGRNASAQFLFSPGPDPNLSDTSCVQQKQWSLTMFRELGHDRESTLGDTLPTMAFH